MHRLARLAAAVLIGFAVTALPLSAHSSANAELRLSAFGDRVEITVVMPANDYAAATGNPLPQGAAMRSKAAGALKANLAVRSRDGLAWQLAVERVEIVRRGGPPDLTARIVARPPGKHQARSFVIDWRLFAPDNPGGMALVVLERDPVSVVGSQDAVLGAMTRHQTSLTVDLGQTNPFASAINAFLIGAHHILEGYDHLLFLLALMLPAPLLARNARWQRPRAPRSAALRIVVTVTAFTLGHSVTLVMAFVWPVALSVGTVESIIALSVLISALHAVRPVLAASEPAIGCTFGLVHGLAFATLLGDSAMGASLSVAALIGFTVGIEAVQLAMVVCAMPALILLAPTRAYTLLRMGLAAAIMLVAALWLLNRLYGVAGALVEGVEAALSLSLIPVAVLLVLTAAVQLWRNRAESQHAHAMTRCNDCTTKGAS